MLAQHPERRGGRVLRDKGPAPSASESGARAAWRLRPHQDGHSRAGSEVVPRCHHRAPPAFDRQGAGELIGAPCSSRYNIVRSRRAHSPHLHAAWDGLPVHSRGPAGDGDRPHPCRHRRGVRDAAVRPKLVITHTRVHLEEWRGHNDPAVSAQRAQVAHRGTSHRTVRPRITLNTCIRRCRAWSRAVGP